uniref:C1q domain-containing protein n=1 Tax=Monopterus albus TaxID=43700 RepID=A0A3Q3J9A3_MONAL
MLCLRSSFQAVCRRYLILFINFSIFRLEGPPGEQGPQGENGLCPQSCDSVQGPPGPQGDLGQPGREGVCNCIDGVNGIDGRPGEKGAKGDKGDTGAQGIQGPIGPKGNEGIIGMTGPPGPCSPVIQSAFFAKLNYSFPIEDFPIPFQIVITNEQGHFNPFNGIYTAPINGTYTFTFDLAVAQRPLKVGLFLNLYPVVKVTVGINQATASQTVILHLAAGDQVWLQVKNAVTNGIFTDSESSSTFSGLQWELNLSVYAAGGERQCVGGCVWACYSFMFILKY